MQPEAEERLIKELTDILISHEGFDRRQPDAQSVSVVFRSPSGGVCRMEAARHRRATASSRRCRKGDTPMHPQGAGQAVTDAVVRADGGKYEDVAPLVWVFPTEIPDGQWGSRGVIRSLPDIQAFIAGEDERRSARNGSRGDAASRRWDCWKVRSMPRARRSNGLLSCILQARCNPGLRRYRSTAKLDREGVPPDPRRRAMGATIAAFGETWLRRLSVLRRRADHAAADMAGDGGISRQCRRDPQPDHRPALRGRAIGAASMS